MPSPEPIPRGPGRWKLNIPFLKDDNFRSPTRVKFLGRVVLPHASAPLPVLSFYADDTSFISSSDAASTADASALFEAGTCWGRQHQLVCVLLGVVSCRVFEVCRSFVTVSSTCLVVGAQSSLSKRS